MSQAFEKLKVIQSDELIRPVIKSLLATSKIKMSKAQSLYLEDSQPEKKTRSYIKMGM